MDERGCQTDRRRFLTTGLTGLAGAALASTGLRAQEATPPAAEKKAYPLITRTLGRTGDYRADCRHGRRAPASS